MAVKMVADLLALSTIKRAGEIVFDKVVEDTEWGSKLDALRGRINGVSPHAIRLYRIRKRTGR